MKADNLLHNPVPGTSTYEALPGSMRPHPRPEPKAPVRSTSYGEEGNSFGVCAQGETEPSTDAPFFLPIAPTEPAWTKKAPVDARELYREARLRQAREGLTEEVRGILKAAEEAL